MTLRDAPIEHPFLNVADRNKPSMPWVYWFKAVTGRFINAVFTGSFTLPNTYYVNNLAEFNQAVALAGSDDSTVIVIGEVSLTENLTLSANIHVTCYKSGFFGGGFSLAINGTFSCEPFQCFGGSGTVTFGDGAVETPLPEWWGAIGNGSTDCLSAIDSAVASYGGSFKLQKNGTYIITNNIAITSKSYFEIDLNGSTIKMQDATPVSGGYALITFSTCSYFKVKNGTFDGNRANRTPAEASAQSIRGFNISYFTFESINSINAPVDGWYFASSTPATASTHARYGLVLNCTASNAYRNNMSIIQGRHINIKGGSYNGATGTNPQAGIDLEMNNSDPDFSIYNINIEGVEMEGNVGYGLLLSPTENPKKISVRGCAINNNGYGAISLGGSDVTIDDNEFETYDDNITESVINSSASSFTREGNVISNNRFRTITASTGGRACISIDATSSALDIFGNTFYQVSCQTLNIQAQGTKYRDNRHLQCTANNLVLLDRDNMICNDNFFDGCTGNVSISTSRDYQQIFNNRFLNAVSGVINLATGAEHGRVDQNYIKFASTGTNVAITINATFRSLKDNIVEGSDTIGSCFTLVSGAATETIGTQSGNICIDDTGNERLPDNGSSSDSLTIESDQDAVVNIKCDANNSGTNDAYTRYVTDGSATAKWVSGYHESDADAMVWSSGDVLGTNNVFALRKAALLADITAGVVFSGIETIAAGGTTTALSLTKSLHSIDADAGGDIFTLADGALIGQVMTIACISSTGVCTITPDNLAGGTSITLNADGETVILQFVNTKWYIMGGHDYTII